MKIIILLISTLFLFADTLPIIKNNSNIKYVGSDLLFDSSIIKGKYFLVTYVDIDEKESNQPTMDKIKALKIPNKTMGLIAIINLAATWAPDMVISGMLSLNIKKYKNTIFVKDYNKELVKLWDMRDDAFNLILFNEKSEIIFMKKGKLSQDEEKEILNILSNPKFKSEVQLLRK